MAKAFARRNILDMHFISVTSRKSKLLLTRQLNRVFLIFFFFQLLSSGGATADHLPPSQPIPSVLLYHSPVHALLHDMHEPSLWSSSFHPAWQIHIHHTLSSMCLFTVCLNHLSLASLTLFPKH